MGISMEPTAQPVLDTDTLTTLLDAVWTAVGVPDTITDGEANRLSNVPEHLLFRNASHSTPVQRRTVALMTAARATSALQYPSDNPNSSLNLATAATADAWDDMSHDRRVLVYAALDLLWAATEGGN